MRSLGMALTAAAAVASYAVTAAAGGYEYTGAGTQSLGRGGAVTARADDPMVLSYNPAGLVELRAKQFLISANLATMDACVDPIGYYGWGAYGGGQPSRLIDPKTSQPISLDLGSSNAGPAGAYYFGKLDSVCLKNGLTPIPEVGLTARLSDTLGVGLGLMYPGFLPQGRWGGENGVIETASGPRPSATRYMQLNSGTLALVPTAGVAYRIAPWLRIGAAFDWSLYNVDTSVMAVVSAGTSPAGDIVAHVRATDLFVPGLTGSVHVVPIDALDLVAAFRYQGDLDAAGSIDLTTGIFSPTSKPHTTRNEIIAVRQNFPWKLRAGARYADRLAPRSYDAGGSEARGNGTQRLRDAFENERWDLEVDLEYQMNGRNRDQAVVYEPGQSVEFESLNGMLSTARFPDTTRDYTSTPKRWRDQISVRAGGSYNILPGLFGVSAGVHWENRGVDPDYMQLDYWPLERLGLHVGFRIRISRTIDLMAAYAHIIQETLVVAAPDHAEGETISAAYTAANNDSDAIRAIDKRTGVAESRSEPARVVDESPKPSVASGTADGTARVAQTTTKSPRGNPPWIVNAGTYRSSIDVLSAGMNIHF